VRVFRSACHITCECVMSRMDASYHARMCHMSESCHARMSHAVDACSFLRCTCASVPLCMPHHRVNASYHARMRHVSGSCHARISHVVYKRVMSLVNESCHI